MILIFYFKLILYKYINNTIEDINNGIKKESYI